MASTVVREAHLVIAPTLPTPDRPGGRRLQQPVKRLNGEGPRRRGGQALTLEEKPSASRRDVIEFRAARDRLSDDGTASRHFQVESRWKRDAGQSSWLNLISLSSPAMK